MLVKNHLFPNDQKDLDRGIVADTQPEPLISGKCTGADDECRCAIFELAGVGMALADDQQRLVLANRTLCRMLGREPEEIVGHPLVDLIHPLDRDGFCAQTSRLWCGQLDHLVLEQRFLRKDGAPLWVRLNGSAVHDDDGQFQNLILILDDVTAAKAAAEDMARLHEAAELERRRLRAVLDVLPVGVFITGPEGRILELNPAARDLWGQPPLSNDQREYGEDYRGWWPDGRRLNSADWAMARALKNGESIGGEEVDIETSDGQRKTILNYARPVRDQRGRTVGGVTVNVDITQRKQVLEQLRELNETLEQRVRVGTAEAEQRAGQLRALAMELTRAEQRERRRVAQILHDHHQQLMVAAKLNLAMLQGRVRRPELEQIFQQINEMLDQSIDGMRSLTVELSPAILYDAGLAAGLEWLGRHVKAKYNLPVEIVHDARAEPTSEEISVFLFQAVRELLFNVVKHAGATQVRVEMGLTAEDFIRIRVEDNGNGFKTERLVEGHSEGFGLFSLRERIELIGGVIYMRSEPGMGTTITLQAPRHYAQQAALRHNQESPRHHPPAVPAPAPRPAPEPGEVRRIRVLLVDDHEILREGLAALLQEYPDIEVAGEALDGELAVELARHIQPDVVIMDVAMPRMGGVEATRRITTQKPGTCVIGLSMYEEMSMAEAMLAAGAAAYLPKGCPADQLIATIRECAPAGH